MTDMTNNGTLGFCNQCCDVTWWKKEIDGRDMTTYWVCVRCEND